LCELKVPDFANNADDLTHLGLLIADTPAGLDAFADYILRTKKFLGEALIYYNDWTRVKLVCFLENSALQERDAHCLEIIQPGDANGSVVPLSFRQWMLFDVEISRHMTPSERQRHNDGREIDSWNGSELGK